MLFKQYNIIETRCKTFYFANKMASLIFNKTSPIALNFINPPPPLTAYYRHFWTNQLFYFRHFSFQFANCKNDLRRTKILLI